jgi:hypothetical protein
VESKPEGITADWHGSFEVGKLMSRDDELFSEDRLLEVVFDIDLLSIKETLKY